MQSSNSRLNRPSGFSLVELLVVIAVIGLLVAILLPAVQAARESARRTTCQKNLRQIGLALHNFESAQKRLPVGAKYMLGFGTSWLVDLLPFVEENGLYQQLNLRIANAGYPTLSPDNGTAADGVILSVLRCPSSPIPNTWKVMPNYRICLPSYVGIAGSINDAQFPELRTSLCCTPAMDGQISAGGVLFPNRAIKLSNVTDGTSRTLCVGEQSAFAIDNLARLRNIDGGYPLGWMTGTNGVGTPPSFVNGVPSSATPPPAPSAWNITTIRYAPNTSTFELPGVKDNPRGPNNPLMSAHTGGVFGLRLDGSVHFIANEIDLISLRREATRDDGN
jgi:prepilin-type N-terminal cleavage/methylation domain-containing protein